MRESLAFICVALLLSAGACSEGDYQGGGRRTDLGKEAGDGISLSEAGRGNTAGSGGNAGGSATAGRGGADCSLNAAAGCEP